jgi:hypothetical protein
MFGVMLNGRVAATFDDPQFTDHTGQRRVQVRIHSVLHESPMFDDISLHGRKPNGTPSRK